MFRRQGLSNVQHPLQCLPLNSLIALCVLIFIGFLILCVNIRNSVSEHVWTFVFKCEKRVKSNGFNLIIVTFVAFF